MLCRLISWGRFTDYGTLPSVCWSLCFRKRSTSTYAAKSKWDFLVSDYISSALLQGPILKSQRLLIFYTWWAHAFPCCLPCCNSGCCSYQNLMHLQSMLRWHLCSRKTLMRHPGASCLYVIQIDCSCAALELNKQKLHMARGGGITSHG